MDISYNGIIELCNDSDIAYLDKTTCEIKSLVIPIKKMNIDKKKVNAVVFEFNINGDLIGYNISKYKKLKKELALNDIVGYKKMDRDTLQKIIFRYYYIPNHHNGYISDKDIIKQMLYEAYCDGINIFVFGYNKKYGIYSKAIHNNGDIIYYPDDDLFKLIRRNNTFFGNIEFDYSEYDHRLHRVLQQYDLEYIIFTFSSDRELQIYPVRKFSTNNSIKISVVNKYVLEKIKSYIGL